MRTAAVAQLILLVIVSLGFFGLMAVLAFHQVPDQNKDVLEGMLGILGAAFGTIIAHFFSTANAEKRAADSSQPLPQNPTQGQA